MIFPSFSQYAGKEIHFPECLRWWLTRNQLTEEFEVSPFLDSKLSDRIMQEWHAAHAVTWTYGGYLEDRSFLLKGSYLQHTKNFIHLGIDCVVPQKTEVASVFLSEVVAVDNDFDIEQGWGPRVIVRLQSGECAGMYAIYAHLENVRVIPGQVLESGNVIGSIGTSPLNGNWFEHLHIQLVEGEYFDELLSSGKISELDGYGNPTEISVLKKRFPDPRVLLGLEKATPNLQL